MKQIRGFIQRALPKGSFRSNVSVLAAGAFLSQALLMLASPILTRVYTSEDFGFLQVYLSISVFLIGVASLRYETAVLIPKDEETAANVMAVAFSTIVLLTSTCVLVTWLLLGTTNYGSPGLRVCIALLSAGMCAAATCQLLANWFTRRSRFDQIARTKLQQIVVMLVSQIALGFWGWGFVGLVLGDVLGKATGIWRLAKMAHREDGYLFQKVSFAGMKSVASRFKAFPLLSTWSVLINTAGYAIPTLLITAWYGPTVAGFLALAERVTIAPASIIAYAVCNVYSSRLATMAHSKPEQLPAFFIRMAATLFLLGLPLSCVFAFAGPTVFSIVFGEAWQESGHYARLLSGLTALVVVTAAVTQTLNILERQSLQLVWDIFRAVFTCGVVYAVHVAQCSSYVAVLAYSAALTISYFVLLAMSFMACVSHARAARASSANPPIDNCMPTPRHADVAIQA